MKMNPPLKLGVLVSHPIQYFVPVYKELARRPGIDLTVIYRTRLGIEAYHDPGFGRLVKWDIPLLDGYRSYFLSDKTALRGVEPWVIREILQRRFDVLIIHGYNYLTNLFAIAIAKLIGTSVIIRGDTRLRQQHLQAAAWKRIFKRSLFKLFDGFLSIGSLNRDYYLAFGAPAERIFFAPFCVNNAAFSFDVDRSKEVRRQFRETFGLPQGSIVVLFVSKLTVIKKPGDLINAYANLAQQFPNAWLIMAGSGEEEKSLKKMVAASALERVRFIGFQNQSVLPGLYVASDIFVMPSEGDAWGLVVNEAMAAGLPVIVSDEVGAAADLVQGHGTGIVYPCGDVKALGQAIKRLLQSEQQRLEMGKRARVLIKAWDVEACVAGIVDAVKHVASK